MSDRPRVLVTGGSGFVGRRTVPLLVERGYDVRCLVRSDAAAAVVTGLGAEPEHGDLDDGAGLADAFRGAGAPTLLNIASLGFGHGPAIVAAAEAGGVDRAIFVSTTAIATTLPARTKQVRLAAEAAIERSKLQCCLLYTSPSPRD